jgi:peroxiredoxin
MRRATAELIASGAGSRALKAGDTAPPFVLNDANGNAVAASKLLAQGPLVVSFYRGVWCPYCNMQLQAVQERWGRSARLARDSWRRKMP